MSITYTDSVTRPHPPREEHPAGQNLVMQGNFEVQAYLNVAPITKEREMHLMVTGDTRLAELALTLNKALNTWDKAPQWIWDLCEMAETKSKP